MSTVPASRSVPPWFSARSTNRLAPRTRLVVGLLLLLLAGLLPVLAWREWSQMSGLPTVRLDADAAAHGWSVAAASVRPLADRIAFSVEPDRPVVIRSPAIDFSADVAPVPYLVLRGLPPGSRVPYSLAWTRDGDPSTYGAEGVWLSGLTGELAPLALAQHRAWRGRVTSLTWKLALPAGDYEALSVSVPALRAGELVAMLWEEWWWRHDFDNAIINSIRPPHVLNRSPAEWLAAAWGVAALTYAGVVVLRGGVFRPAILLYLAIAAWMVNDLRWAANQAGRLRQDLAAFRGGASEDEAWAAAGGTAFAELLQHAIRNIPPGSVYATVNGAWTPSDPVVRYYLSPDRVQVNTDAAYPLVPVESVRYLIVLTPALVRMEPATGLTHVPGLPPLHAGVLVQLGNGMFIAKVLDQ